MQRDATWQRKHDWSTVFGQCPMGFLSPLFCDISGLYPSNAPCAKTWLVLKELHPGICSQSFSDIHPIPNALPIKTQQGPWCCSKLRMGYQTADNPSIMLLRWNKKVPENCERTTIGATWESNKVKYVLFPDLCNLKDGMHIEVFLNTLNP